MSITGSSTNFDARMKQLTRILGRKSRKELIGLMVRFIEKHPDLEQLVAMKKGELVSKIRGLFSMFWDWKEVRQLMSELDTILEGVRSHKKLWSRDLLNEMEACANIMIKKADNVFGEDELAIFLEDWFETFGEVFVKTKPTINEKREFVLKICELIKKDDYGFHESFEKALISMCCSKKDAELIKEIVKPLESSYATAKEHYEDLYEELDEKSK